MTMHIILAFMPVSLTRFGVLNCFGVVSNTAHAELMISLKLHLICVCLAVQWVYSGRARDRGQLMSDVIDIDAEHDEAQFQVDGSGNDADDEADDQSGDGDEEESSGGIIG